MIVIADLRKYLQNSKFKEIELTPTCHGAIGKKYLSGDFVVTIKDQLAGDAAYRIK